MSSRRGLDAFFDIHEGERRLVALLFLHFFFVGASATFTQATAFALFLTRFSSDKLPVTYIAMAVIVTLLTLAYTGLGRRLSFSARLKVSVAGQLLVVVGFAAGLAVSDVAWLIFALPILFQIVVGFGNLTFWSLAGRMLNVRQGKRLFGLVGAGQWLAIVIMGFLTPAIVSLIGLSNLLWLAALATVGVLVVMSVTLSAFGHLVGAPDEGDRPPTAVPAAAGATRRSESRRARLMRDPYVASVFALTFVWWVAFFFVDNIFYARAEQQFSDGEQLAGFLGIYLGALGIITLLSNFFVSGRVMGQFGLRASLLVLPVGLTVGSVVLVALDVAGGPLVALFGAAVMTKMWDLSVGFSLDQSARSVLYQPLRAALRTRVQTAADGIVQPLATGAAGAALLAIGVLGGSALLPLSIGLLVLAGALLGFALRVGSSYRVRLVDALGKRTLATADLVVADAASVSALRRGLHDDHPGAVMYSMRMLAAIDRDGLIAALPNLLTNPEVDVRRYALEQIRELQVDGALPAVRECLSSDGAPTVAAAALKTLAAFGDVDSIRGHLDADDPTIRIAAIAGLLNSRAGGEAVAASAEAERRLAHLVASTVAEDRALAADVLGECAPNVAVEPLMELLADPDAGVRRRALRAAGCVRAPELWETVIAALADRSTRSAAVSALVAGGETAISQVGRALGATGVATDEVIHLTRVCERARDETAIPDLVRWAGSDHAEVRSGALRALRMCGYRSRETDGQELAAAIRTEAAHVAWLAAASEAVGGLDDSPLLQTALAEEVDAGRDRVVDLLSFHGDAGALRRAEISLEHGSADRVAYALEIIDIETPRHLRGVVLSVVDKLEPSERLERLRGEFPQPHEDGHTKLAELADNPRGSAGAWTQACALHVAGVIGLPDLHRMCTRLVDSPSELVSEIAAQLQQEHPPPGELEMLTTIEKVLVLRNAGIFAETSDEILGGVASVATVTHAEAGEHIIAAGDAGNTMFVIASGRVKVHDGDQVLGQLEAGDVFGEMALLDTEVRSASVTAVEDTQLLSLDQQAFFDLIDERPEIARGLLKLLSRRLRATSGDLSELRDRQPTAP